MSRRRRNRGRGAAGGRGWGPMRGGGSQGDSAPGRGHNRGRFASQGRREGRVRGGVVVTYYQISGKPESIPFRNGSAQ